MNDSLEFLGKQMTVSPTLTARLFKTGLYAMATQSLNPTVLCSGNQTITLVEPLWSCFY